MKRYSALLIIRKIQNYNEISPYTSKNDHQKFYKQARTYYIAHGTLLNVVAAWMGEELGGEWIHVWLSPLLKLSQCS